MSILPDNSDEVGDKLDAVLELLHDAIDHHRLSAWEDEFVASLLERLEQYGSKTFISEKQWAILDRLEEKIYR